MPSRQLNPAAYATGKLTADGDRDDRGVGEEESACDSRLRRVRDHHLRVSRAAWVGVVTHTHTQTHTYTHKA